MVSIANVTSSICYTYLKTQIVIDKTNSFIDACVIK